MRKSFISGFDIMSKGNNDNVQSWLARFRKNLKIS